jgi:hypothetical protein
MKFEVIGRLLIGILSLVVAMSVGVGCTDSTHVSFVPTEPIAPLVAPFEMPALERPSFPDRVFDIRDYGAVADGATMNSAAIAGAISACAKSGGGTVLIPPGLWLTGPIHLKSNVNLHAAKGATVRFSTRFEDYLPVVLTRWEGIEVLNYSPLIYANGADNIALTGSTAPRRARCGRQWSSPSTAPTSSSKGRPLPAARSGSSIPSTATGSSSARSRWTPMV